MPSPLFVYMRRALRTLIGFTNANRPHSSPRTGNSLAPNASHGQSFYCGFRYLRNPPFLPFRYNPYSFLALIRPRHLSFSVRSTRFVSDLHDNYAAHACLAPARMQKHIMQGTAPPTLQKQCTSNTKAKKDWKLLVMRLNPIRGVRIR